MSKLLRRAAWTAALLMPAMAWSAADLEALMSRLSEQRTGHALFTEQHYVALLEGPVQTSGELFYEAPDKLEKRTLQPRPEILRVASGMLYVESGRMKRSVPVQRYPELAAFIESMRATLAGDLPALQKYFNIDFQGDQQRWQLQLTPRDRRLAAAIRQVRLSGDGVELRRVEVQQDDGDRSVMDIQPLP